MVEEWRDVAGSDGRYQVSNIGRVRSCSNYHGGKMKKWKILKQTENNKGYMYVTIEKKQLVHRIVGSAFLPKDEDRDEVNHKDGNPKNNCVDNLEWCTRSENNIHKNKVLGHSGVEKKRIPVICVETGEVFESQTAAINAGMACDWTHLKGALKNPMRTCYGKHWRYANGTEN